MQLLPVVAALIVGFGGDALPAVTKDQADMEIVKAKPIVSTPTAAELLRFAEDRGHGYRLALTSCGRNPKRPIPHHGRVDGYFGYATGR
jgi:hypothetical protein